MNSLKNNMSISFPDRPSLLFLVVICTLANIPYFLGDYYPVHDTLSVFQIFSYYYSELSLNHEIPWWLPYTSYGMPIDSHVLFSFGPFQYLALAVGYIAGINNTLHLFSTSLAFDSLLLGLGSLLFCQHILKERFSSLVCVASILLLVFYDRQVYWNFKILIPLPLALYLVQRGIERLNPAYLLWAGAILLSWSFGSVTYTLVAQVYIVAAYGIAFWIASTLLRQSWSEALLAQWLLFKQRVVSRNVLVHSLAPSLVIVVCLAMMYAIRTVMSQHMAYNALGRGANMGVDLKTYLTYGGGGETDKILELFNGIPTSNAHDYLVYIGLVNFGFVLLGLMSIKKIPSQMALLVTTGLVIAFTILATGVAELAYSLPGMSLIRHIAYFITVGKLFLIILAGFGAREIVTGNSKSIHIYLIAAGAICLWWTPMNKENLYNFHALVTASFLVVFVSLAWFFKAPRRLLLWGCILISLTDMVSYRLVVFKMADLFLVAFPDEFKTVQATPYRPERLEEKDADVLKRYRLKPMDIYGGGDSYLREDFCKGSRQDLVAPGVKQLFHLRVWRDRIMTDPRDALDAKGDQTLRRALGCGVPKLRMVGSVSYARDEATAEQLVCCRADIDERPVIIGPESVEMAAHLPSVTNKDAIAVKEFSPNKLRILVYNSEAAPQWLIYADAFDERWTATVDGVSRPLYKANVAFKALKVEPGLHEIVLYLPRPLMNVLFSVFALIMSSIAAGMVGGILWRLLKRTQPGREAGTN